jgi:CRISPR/Cas system type I-B associated protein Csh2 (Cas7 group RAMP superfamily)
MRPIPRGKYLDERLRRSSTKAAENHIRCPACGGWIDVRDLGAVADHAGPLPHPAIDQQQ